MAKNIFHYQPAHAAWKRETVVSFLPAAYQAFYKEWKLETPKPVHYVPEPGRWRKNPETGEIQRVENVPIPLRHPAEVHRGLWGGEAVIRGYQNRSRFASLIPHWWVPQLHRTVLYSEVLDQHLDILVTHRALKLVHDHYGLDSYLLQNRACDIYSLLGLKLKREILLALVRCTLHPNNPVRRQELLDKYKDYIIPEEEAEWYGLSLGEALKKHRLEEQERSRPRPLKLRYRAELLERLSSLELEQKQQAETAAASQTSESSWLNRINPFGDKTLGKR